MKRVHRLRIVVAIIMALMCRRNVTASEIVTIAGSGVQGYSGDKGPALKAELDQPFGLEIAPDGMLYFCDFGNHVVRRLDLNTGLIITVAGTGRKYGYSGDGDLATKAQFHEPHEIRFDRDGTYYVSDTRSCAIRRVDGKSGVITTVAGTGQEGFGGDGGAANSGQMNLPIAVLLDSDRGLLICDIKNHRIRRVDPASGFISTFAGTGESKPTVDGGPLSSTPLKGPRSLALYANGDLALVLREGNAVYRLDRKAMTIHHLAGTGQQGYSGDGADARQARFAGPKGIAVDHDGNVLLCDTENHVIRRIERSTGRIETLIGDGKPGDGPDGAPQTCRLNRPHGIFIDRDGTIYLGDSGNHKVRKLTK